MKQWYKTRKKDPFYIKAKKNDIISRAYYKLEEIDKKHNLFKNDKKILDVGCSPGGWTQYILNKHPKNKIVGIDILPTVKQIEGKFKFYMMDLNQYQLIDELFTLNKLTYSDASKTMKDTETLKVGDFLAVNSESYSTRYKITSIDSSKSM